jgi:type II secretory pathway component PulC
MIQQTAANTYVVRISDLRRWQLFDWVDVALTKQRDGVRVATVKGLPFVSLERSPLPSLGVRYGDLILRINSTKIRTPTDIEHAVLAAIEQGLPAIEVEIRRGWTVATVALRYELVP